MLQKKNRPYLGLIQHVLTSVIFPILIPTTIISFALFRMNIHPNTIGYLDHMTFILLSYFILIALLKINWMTLRILSSFLFVILLAIFFLSNSLYYEFFNGWGRLETFKQWNDVPAIWEGILRLSTLDDFIFFFILPLLFLQLSMQGRTLIFKKLKLAFLVLTVSMILIHQAYAVNSVNYMESNPFLFMIRQKRLSTSLAKVGSSHLAVSKQLSQYQPLNHTLYTHSENGAYPFLKKSKPHPPSLPFALKSKPNVILILMESMRAFEMGAYGAPLSYTPHLDEMAKEGIFFKNYYSPANQTIRAEFSILSSYQPDVLGGPVYVNNADLSVLTLPGLLRKNGYETHWIEAECASFSQRKINFLKSRGISQFHTDVPRHHPPLGMGAADEDTFDYAFDIFSKSQKPFFAEIMTLSNHWEWNNPYPTIPNTPPAEGEMIYKNYTRGIFYTDNSVYKFIEKIRKSPLYKNTIIVITGDHGVGFYPRRASNGNEIWKTEIATRVPFIIWSPNLIKPRVVKNIGSHLDLTPTVLDLIDIHQDNPFMGTSLLRDDTDGRFVFVIRDGLWSLRFGDDFAVIKSPAINLNTPPFNIKTYLDKVYGNEFGHIYFHSDGDQLQHWKPELIKPVSDDQAKHLEEWGEAAIAAYHSVIYHNQIYPR